ncbi:NUDIX hydrolase [Micromonospora mangrovi]|uniref:NUDIX hydrolase n=2 Tax=Micromonospora TaxID=1873 RepID=A0AAU7M902_9ACTN
MDERTRRSRYQDVREGLPELFVNPPGAPVEILLDPSDVAAAERSAADDLARVGLPASWGETGVVYMDPFVMVLRDAVRTPLGALGTYSRTVNAGNAPGVVVLPCYRGSVVLLRHFRHSTRSWHLEVPRGFGTPGGNAADDARRELLEEIGVPAARIEPLGLMFPDTGQSATEVHLFHAEIDDEPRIGDPAEGIDEVRLVTAAELAALIRDGAITDGFTMAAFTRALLRGVLRGIDLSA